MRYDALLFDLDGTLVDSLPDLVASVNETRAEFGEDPLPEDTVRRFVGDGMLKLVQRSLPEHDGQKILGNFRRYYDANLLKRTLPYDGVKDVLETLREDGYKMAVVTNKMYEPAVRLLKALELDAFFDVVIGGDGPAGAKPLPGPFTAALDELGCEVENALMVGDGKPDILGARGLNLAVCGALYGIGFPEEIRALKPNFLIDEFNQLLRIL